MDRLKGIGVSPGVVAGRAVVLIQRAHVLRYQIAPARLDEELRRLDESRVRSREQLLDIQSRTAARRPELSSLFDAQLLMLDDPMLLPRAADIVREQRVNAEWAVQQVFHEVQRDVRGVRRSVPPGAPGRCRRSRRTPAHEPAQGSGHAARSSARPGRVVGAHRGRADAVDRGAGRLDQGSRLRDRRRQPDVPHRHPRPFARRAGGRGPAQRESAGAGRATRRHRRQRQRGDHRPDAARSLRARRITPTITGPRRPSTPSADAPRRPPTASPSASTRTSSFRTTSRHARYAGAEGIGLYRSEFLVTSGVEDIGDEDRQYRDLSRHARGDGAGIGDRAHVRRRRGAAGVATLESSVDRRLGAGRSTRQPSGPSRPSPEPHAAGPVPDPASRAAARGAPREPADHVPVRVERRADPGRARDGGRQRQPIWRGAANRCRRCRSA